MKSLNKIEFNINNPPPTSEQLAAWGIEATDVKRQTQAQRLYLNYLLGGLVILIAVGLMASWSMELITAKQVVAGAVIVGVIVVVVAFIATVAVAFAGAAAVVIAAAAASAAAVVVTGADAFIGVVAAAVAAAVVVNAAVAVAEALEKKTSDADNRLDELKELNPYEFPDQCIEYDQFMSNDQYVNAYQTQLVTMGRKPVVAEYQAAKVWVDGTESRHLNDEKERAALEVFERMSRVN